MVQLTDTESELVDQLLAALEESISALPEIDIEFANKTKIQKLLYFAIDEFEIPITYSWYLAGAVVPDRSIGPTSLSGPRAGPTMPGQTSSTSAEPAASESTDSPAIDPILFSDSSGENSGNPSPSLEKYVDHDTVVDFFRDVIPEVWHEQTMRFLQNFYQETAPEEYRLLYIESTHLRTHLGELAEAVECQLEGRTPVRSIATLRESIELSISDLHYYLRQHNQLRQTFNIVVDGTDLIEDALLMLDQLSTDEFRDEHLSLIQKLQDFFYYYIWKYPCLLISQQTATGPRAEELRTERAAEFETFDDEVRTKRAELESELSAAGLLPGPNDYPPIEDRQLADTLSDLSSEYLE